MYSGQSRSSNNVSMYFFFISPWDPTCLKKLNTCQIIMRMMISNALSTWKTEYVKQINSIYDDLFDWRCIEIWMIGGNNKKLTTILSSSWCSAPALSTSCSAQHWAINDLVYQKALSKCKSSILIRRRGQNFQRNRPETSNWNETVKLITKMASTISILMFRFVHQI